MFCPYCGKEIDDNADVCLGCGRSVSNVVKAASNDSNSMGWWCLGFFFPIIGFILWLVWTGNKPMRAKRAGWGALTGVIVSVVLTILVFVAVAVLTYNIVDTSYTGYYI